MLARYMRERAARPVRYALDEQTLNNMLGLNAALMRMTGSPRLPALRQRYPGVGQLLSTPVANEVAGEFMDDPTANNLRMLHDLMLDLHGEDAVAQLRGEGIRRDRVPEGSGPLQLLLSMLHVGSTGSAQDNATNLREYGNVQGNQRYQGEVMAFMNSPYGDLLRQLRGLHPAIGRGHDMLAHDTDLRGVIPASVGVAHAARTVAPAHLADLADLRRGLDNLPGNALLPF